MRRYSLAVFLISTFMLSSLSGCLGLLQARETIEGMRDPVREVSYPDKVNMLHTFTTVSVQPYTNFTSFPVDDAVESINVYFKVSFFGSDTISCFDEVITKQARYIQAQITSPSGEVLWSQDECKDLQEVVEIDLEPLIEEGDWELTVESRGWGETTAAVAQDHFIIIVTINRVCQQYPLETPCDE